MCWLTRAENRATLKLQSGETNESNAIPSIDRVARPRQDPVFGKGGPSMQIWPPREKRRS